VLGVYMFYSKVNPRILCPEHVEMPQCPPVHLYGSGCSKCIYMCTKKRGDK
jgi:hypothetical protein